jgi:hypothetical protein
VLSEETIWNDTDSLPPKYLGYFPVSRSLRATCVRSVTRVSLVVFQKNIARWVNLGNTLFRDWTMLCIIYHYHYHYSNALDLIGLDILLRVSRYIILLFVLPVSQSSLFRMYLPFSSGARLAMTTSMSTLTPGTFATDCDHSGCVFFQVGRWCNVLLPPGIQCYVHELNF